MNQPIYRMPTAAEVLAGQTQGGVPRPAASTDALFDAATPAPARRRSIWARVRTFVGGSC